MSKQNHQKGFSVVEILLIVVLVAIIAGTGWYVWNANKNANKTLNEANSTQFTQPTKGSKKSTGGTPANTQQYLTIKEWGVKIPMPSTVDINDLEYNLHTVTSDSNSSEAILGSLKLGAVAPSCDVKNGGSTPFGSIERMSPTAYEQASKNPRDTGVSNGVLSGNYYYVWQVPRANCAGVPNEPGAEQANQMLGSNLDNFPTNMPTILKSIKSTS